MEKQPIDIVWIVLCAGLVFLMQAGFTCLESGLTRSKNSINVAIKNITDFGISVSLFWMFGFALMFGVSENGWFGTTHFFTAVRVGGPSLAAYFLFQTMFCGTATTIVSGAVAERMRFSGYMIVAVLISGFIYTLFGHWAWGGLLGGRPGWLAELGFVDFAGSTVVHSVGGWVALATAIVVGPRQGRFPPDGPPRWIPGHNLPVAILGTLLLWLGWFGFNGGSTFSASGPIASIAVNTVLAGAAGMLMSLAIGWPLRGRPDVDLVINGSLAGLVAITAGCNAVGTSGAVMIGAVGGIVMLAMRELLERLRIDDVVGAVPVHAGAGAWGAIAVALFGNRDVLGTGLGRGAQLGVQMLGVAVCFLWAFGVVYLFLYLVNRFFPLRVTVEQERIGLNVAEHGVTTEILDLLNVMQSHAATGDPGLRAPVEPFTEIGQVAKLYNRVLDSFEQAAAKTDAIVSVADDAFITFSKGSLAITSVNPSAVAMFGSEEGELIGLPISNLFGSRFGEPSSDIHAVLGGDLSRRWETVGVRADGSEFSAEIIATEANIGSRSFYTANIRDITDRERTEQKLKTEEQLLRKLLDLNERERQLVAYEIHDGIVQDMVGVQMLLETLGHRWQLDQGPTGIELAAIQQLVGKALDEGRRMIDELRPLIIDEEGIVDSISYLIAEQQTKSALAIEFTHEGKFERLEPLLEGTVFRIVQEALTNIRRHSQSDQAEVQLTQTEDMLRLEIRDRGAGFNPSEVPSDRFGLRGIRERARLFGGYATIVSSPGEGTCIRVELPIALATQVGR